MLHRSLLHQHRLRPAVPVAPADRVPQADSAVAESAVAGSEACREVPATAEQWTPRCPQRQVSRHGVLPSSWVSTDSRQCSESHHCSAPSPCSLRAGISTNFEATLSFFLLRLKNVSTSIIKGFCAAAESMDDTRMQRGLKLSEAYEYE